MLAPVTTDSMSSASETWMVFDLVTSHWEFVQRRHVSNFRFQSLCVSVSVVLAIYVVHARDQLWDD